MVGPLHLRSLPSAARRKTWRKRLQAVGITGRHSATAVSPSPSLGATSAPNRRSPAAAGTFDEREELQRLRPPGLAVRANAASLVDGGGDRQPRLQAIA
jgi:hypothetical protein